jgi:hypothetical protein
MTGESFISINNIVQQPAIDSTPNSRSVWLEVRYARGTFNIDAQFWEELGMVFTG